MHLVDKGIDTGNIIKVKNFNLADIKNIEELELTLNYICAKNLVSIIISLLDGDSINEIKQNNIDGKQYFKMSRKNEKDVNFKLIDYLKNNKVKH